MKRLELIGFAACAFAAMPSFSVSAMPMAPADQLIAGTDSSVILAKGGRVVAGAEPLSAGHPDGAGAKGWLAWCGLPSRPLEARALLKRSLAVERCAKV